MHQWLGFVQYFVVLCSLGILMLGNNSDTSQYNRQQGNLCFNDSHPAFENLIIYMCIVKMYNIAFDVNKCDVIYLD